MLKLRTLKPLVPLGLALLAMNAQADVIGLQAGAGIWQPDLSGHFRSEESSSRFDVERDLGYSDTSANTFYVALEHPIPLLHNIRIERTQLSENSEGSISGRFNGQDYNGAVKTTLDLSHTDFTGYYEILDGLAWLHADVGITVRQFDGEISIDSNALDIDAPVPLFYGKGQVDLPFAPFPVAVGGLINYLSVDGASVSDRRFYLSATAPLTLVDLGGEIGYRDLSIELDDVDDLNSDLSASGWYASAILRF